MRVDVTQTATSSSEAPEVPRVGRSGRAATVESRVTIDHETRARVVMLAREGLSLRAIAREVGVSHEAVRTVLRAEIAAVA
jgi:transposase-like protein